MRMRNPSQMRFFVMENFEQKKSPCPRICGQGKHFILCEYRTLFFFSALNQVEVYEVLVCDARFICKSLEIRYSPNVKVYGDRLFLPIRPYFFHSVMGSFSKTFSDPFWCWNEFLKMIFNPLLFFVQNDFFRVKLHFQASFFLSATDRWSDIICDNAFRNRRCTKLLPRFYRRFC